MKNKMECDRCKRLVDETTTSSCSAGAVDISELIPAISKDRLKKLCTFDNQFFCEDCMSGCICVDCAAVLTKEDVELIANRIK